MQALLGQDCETANVRQLWNAIYKQIWYLFKAFTLITTLVTFISVKIIIIENAYCTRTGQYRTTHKKKQWLHKRHSTFNISPHSLNIIPWWINCDKKRLKLCTQLVFIFICNNMKMLTVMLLLFCNLKMPPKKYCLGDHDRVKVSWMWPYLSM